MFLILEFFGQYHSLLAFCWCCFSGSLFWKSIDSNQTENEWTKCGAKKKKELPENPLKTMTFK